MEEERRLDMVWLCEGRNITMKEVDDELEGAGNARELSGIMWKKIST